MSVLKKTLATILCAIIATAFTMNAQMMPKLPLDTAVRYGKLPNGLTYYIRHNEKPKGQADFYIAQKVGSILEEDNQRGLAHFLEHMCFNGTQNFPGNSLIDYLESVGVKFGANLNAYTSVDETVYNISNVPTARESVQDSVLLILHDWADGLLLDPEEIDKERGVIHEEWRRSMVGQMRILEKILPDMYPGSRYGYRLPIGTIDVIDNFKPEEIREYYETWYRPDQQGIIIVGDIDVDRIEKKIQELFSPIKMPEVVKERVYFPVDDTPGTIFAIGSDPEQSNAIIEILFKQDALPEELKGTMAEMSMDYVIYVINAMLNERLNDIAMKPDATFASASAGYGDYFLSKTKDALTLSGIPKDNSLAPVLETIYREALRAAKTGFTQSEYDRAKANYMATIESAYKDRDNVESNRYVREYVRHFIDGDAAPGVETEWMFAQQVVPMVPLEMINQTIAGMITPDNRVVIALLPENEKFTIPSEQELKDIMSKVDEEEITAYVDETRTDPFIPTLPQSGTIVSDTMLPEWDAHQLILSNGVRIIVKPTKFKEDEIIINGIALGGIENTEIADSASVIFMKYALGALGYGNYTESDVQKYLAGKKVSFKPENDFYSRGFKATSTPKDLQYVFELIYNYFTNPNIDENEYNSLAATYASVMANQEAQPQAQFSKNVLNTLYSDPRQHMLTSDIIDKADRETILNTLKGLTANASDFTIIITGNVDLESLEPLLKQYVATLPVNEGAEIKYMPSLSYEIAGGNDISTFVAPMQTEQTFVGIFVPAQMQYTAKDRALLSIASQILSKRLIDTVREEMGAVYSINAAGAMNRLGINNTVIQSVFPMKPEMKDEVLTFIHSQFDDMTNNIGQEEFAKVIEYMTKSAKENKEKNRVWNNAIEGWIINGVDTFNNDVELLNSLTPADVQDLMKRVLNNNNYRVIILEAEK